MQDLYDGHGWKLTLEEAPLPDGRSKQMVRVQRADTVHIIAEPAEGRVLLLREYRPFYGSYVWMLPSGKVDKEHDHAVAAQRELQEETGMRAAHLQHYCTCYPAESISIARHLYIASNLTPDPLPQDATELIEVHDLPLEEAIEHVLGDDHLHDVSAFGLLRFARDGAAR